MPRTPLHAGERVSRCYAHYRTRMAAPPSGSAIVISLQVMAGAGHAGAQYNLGLMYLKREGVPRDALHGLEWLAMAADNGDMKAQVLLQRIDQALVENEAGRVESA